MRRNRWLIGAFCGVLAVGGAAVPTLLMIPGSHASAPPPPDMVQYVQAKQSGYLSWVPGSGVGGFNQTLSGGGGGCSSPTVANAVLQFNAAFYNTSTVYAGSSVPASAGAYQGRTGVCAIPQDWSIDYGEGLIFDVGPNAVVSGRLFSEASIVLQRQDKTATPSDTVNLVLRRGGTKVVTLPFVINGPAGSTVTADTGLGTYTFDEVEIQDTAPTDSISVVGPTNTFTMQSQLCAGSQIFAAVNPNDDPSLQKVNITATGSGCKQYSAFTATGATGAVKTINFAAQGGAPTEMFSALFDWGDVPYCTPPNGGVISPPAPRVCPATLISFDGGVTRVPETFCPGGANPPNTPAWCAVDVKYSFDPIPNTNPQQYWTHIVEDWSGKGPDPAGYCC